MIRQSRSRRAAIIGLALAGVAIALVALEFLYRGAITVRYRRHVAIFAREPWRIVLGSPLVFRLPVSHSGRVPLGATDESVPYRTNGDGFRDGERRAKSPGIPRILVLGDSYAFGWGVLDHEPFPQRLEALFRGDGRAVEVINAAIPGYNTEQEAILLDELLPKYEPDLVLVSYVMNDAEPQGNVPQPPGITYRYVSSWVWEDAHELFRRRILRKPTWRSTKKLTPSFDFAAGFAPESPKWRESKAALARMASLCRSRSTPLRVAVLPDFTKPFDAASDFAVRREVGAWCRELALPAVDLTESFLGSNHGEFGVPWDGHPNAAAHERIAKVLKEWLRDELG